MRSSRRPKAARLSFNVREHMTPHQIVALGIRLFSLYLGIHSLRYLVELPASMATNNLAPQIHISYITGGAFLALAVVLWFFPMFIAHRILPNGPSERTLNLQAFDAARVGCSLIGLWFTVYVLPALSWLIFSHAVNSGNQAGSLFSALSPDDKRAFFFLLAELLFALILIFKSHFFAQIVVGIQSNAKAHRNAL